MLATKIILTALLIMAIALFFALASKGRAPRSVYMAIAIAYCCCCFAIGGSLTMLFWV